MSSIEPFRPNEVVDAWIDVGGTFTDCYVQSNSLPRRRIKVLSSGRVPISCGKHTAPSAWVAPELVDDVTDFWRGATLRGWSSSGDVVAQTSIVGFDAPNARLLLEHPVATEWLSRDSHSSNSPPHVAWEVDAGIEAPVLAVRRLLGCGLTHPLPRLAVRLGTTRGTNALLTRRGAPAALAITAPFEDLLLIGDQTRPGLFDLAIDPQDSLTQWQLPIHERLDARGQVLVELDETHAREQLQAALAAGCQSLAICLMHSYANPVHELRLEQLARSLGFQHISRSSALAPLIEIVARARTTVVDAYLSPIIREYLSRLVTQFGGSPATQLLVMTSAGGLIDWRQVAGKDTILSGPAGGVVALGALARATRQATLIGLDMGGTSTDVCRTSEQLTLEYESTKAGVRLLTPTLPIETVAAGGGSICWFDGVSLRVGPQSAGAAPGPACYGRGGPLTITDLNVFLGRLPELQFPFPLDHGAIEQRLQELLLPLAKAGLPFASPQALAEGLRQIANQQMADAVRTVSIAQGVDPRSHALVGFGGAAGQHICEIADILGIKQIIDSADAGLMSALGMGLAVEQRDGVVSVYQPLSQADWLTIEQRTNGLLAELQADWQVSPSPETRLWLELRYRGTDTTLKLPLGGALNAVDWRIIQQEFHNEHRRRFGYARAQHDTELVAVRAQCSLVNRETSSEALEVETALQYEFQADNSAPLWTDDGEFIAAHVPRSQLKPGARIAGPAIVLSSGSTLVIAPGWQATTLSDGTLRLRPVRMELVTAISSEKVSAVESQHDTTASRDPVAEAVFAQRLAAIATQMGLVLQQTALSVNVKQRRDFSCAVFDSAGRMLASAPHVPVHLGAMGATVRAAMALYPDLSAGQCVITNDPYQGGSHLPDVTVISPVAEPASSRPIMYVANRAHHADIGGIAPGSMCVDAGRLGEEGAIIEPLRLRAEDSDELKPVRDLLERAEFPPRNIDENLADLRAQLAANARGQQLIGEMATTYGWGRVPEQSAALLRVAEQRVRNYIAQLPRTVRTFTDALDDGTLIAVKIEPASDGRLLIDFNGSGPTSPRNFNANPSIVTAAVIYVLRCLIADDLPLNEGMLAALDVRIPPGILNPNRVQPVANSPAVAAGNVETSQRVVDCLLGAFGVAAASQGTMNNLLFGNARFGFYETICGGAGATKGHHGASGVHTHMTNTRLTDPEVLESKYPARLSHFGLRRGSGGRGRWSGGEGVVRTLTFLAPVQVSLLTSRRGGFQPYGASGGLPGAAGQNTLIDASGRRSPLPGTCQLQIEAGQSIEIQTPGGGGYGAP